MNKNAGTIRFAAARHKSLLSAAELPNEATTPAPEPREEYRELSEIEFEFPTAELDALERHLGLPADPLPLSDAA